MKIHKLQLQTASEIFNIFYCRIFSSMNVIQLMVFIGWLSRSTLRRYPCARVSVIFQVFCIVLYGPNYPPVEHKGLNSLGMCKEVKSKELGFVLQAQSDPPVTQNP